jgi:hypothetical protein
MFFCHNCFDVRIDNGFAGVTLKKHGPEVTLEEFLTWDAKKQAMNLIPPAGCAVKGRTPWNLGLERTDEEKKNISLSRVGKAVPKAGNRQLRTEEHKDRIRQTILNNPGSTTGKRIVTSPQGTFPSMKAWSDATGITSMTLRKWCKVYPDEYKLTVSLVVAKPKPVTLKPGTPEHRKMMSKVKSRPFMTPVGVYANRGLASKDLNMDMVHWMKKMPDQFYYIKDSK